MKKYGSSAKIGDTWLEPMFLYHSQEELVNMNMNHKNYQFRIWEFDNEANEPQINLVYDSFHEAAHETHDHQGDTCQECRDYAEYYIR